WQVWTAPRRPYRLVIANGPPDNETIAGGASILRREGGRRRTWHNCLDGGPGRYGTANDGHHLRVVVVSFLPSVREAAARHVPALVAQEALDVRDEVIARWQPLLVVHRLEPLRVRAGRMRA